MTLTLCQSTDRVSGIVSGYFWVQFNHFAALFSFEIGFYKAAQ
jgi:hypothetical protein